MGKIKKNTQKKRDFWHDRKQQKGLLHSTFLWEALHEWSTPSLAKTHLLNIPIHSFWTAIYCNSLGCCLTATGHKIRICCFAVKIGIPSPACKMLWTTIFSNTFHNTPGNSINIIYWKLINTPSKNLSQIPSIGIGKYCLATLPVSATGWPLIWICNSFLGQMMGLCNTQNYHSVCLQAPLWAFLSYLRKHLIDDLITQVKSLLIFWVQD